MTDLQPIERLTLDARELMGRRPPTFNHPHKKAILARCYPPSAPPSGQIRHARWPAIAPPGAPANRACEVREVEGVFTYPEPPQGCIDWHLNFADPHLFVAYASSLLAQDELQALEHPQLGSLRDELLARGMKALTQEDDRPTPVTVAGVERRCAIDTSMNADEGRPYGLYGNRFARARLEDVQAATQILSPPTISNLLAIAAMACGQGRYGLEDLSKTLTIACSGFAAARAESDLLRPGCRARLHTGFWGCGAFGGNRVLMALLQSHAAALAGLDELLFYTFDDAGSQAFHEAMRLRSGPLAFDGSTPRWLEKVAAHGFVWGTSDGN